MAQAWFCEHTKMADVVLGNQQLWFVLPYFGIELGFGEKSIGQLCTELRISKPLLLLICNLYAFEDYTVENVELKRIPIRSLLEFLQNSHRDFLDVRMPRIIDSVLELLLQNRANGEMIASFCEKFCRQVVRHLKYEDEVVFPYIHRRLNGEPTDCRIGDYEHSHDGMDAALEDLKNIIVKYLPPTCTMEQCRHMLFDLFAFDHDLRKHAWLEERVLIPLVALLENGQHSNGVELSGREEEILVALAHGMSSKQIADKFKISVHTVMSHRKNIVRKTKIKTVAGLTLYALLKNLISRDDLQPSL